MKHIVALLAFVVVSIIAIGPFALVGYGIAYAFCGLIATALLCTATGMLLLWLIKPISILTNKNHRIF